MRLSAIVYRLENGLFQKRLVRFIGAVARSNASLFASLSLMAIVVSVAGCGQPSVPEEAPEAASQAGTVILPTLAPTLAPSPVNTRVLPLEVITPVPTSAITPTITPIPDEVRALVVEVIDGDTISVIMDGDPPSRVYVVRYLGIDAPPNAPDSPWGNVAYETNRKLTKLKAVRLVRDKTDSDEEGRLLRHVFIGNDLLSILLAEQGLGRANVTEPDTRFKAEIEEAAARAQNNGLGLWGQPPTAVPTSTQPADAEETTPEPEATATVTAAPTTPESTAEPVDTPTADETVEANASVTPSVVADEAASGDQLQGP